MPSVNIVVESKLEHTMRVRQMSSMFDCPVTNKTRLTWDIEFPIEDSPWNVGLIVGPSGSGKSTIMREVWGEPPTLDWKAMSVVDDFAPSLSIENIGSVCQAVGFNTIPAWMRPFAVLSNGEKFRVDMARRLLELPDPIVVDEFTSVVDRQVGQIGAHAVQRYCRKHNRQLVAVTCHYDVLDWLQPDWVLDMATRSFTRRSLQQRPKLDIAIGRLPYAAWSVFAPFHYLTANLHRSARCFGLWVGDTLAAFAAILHRPHALVRDIMGVSRGVTLPDWQGIGLMSTMVSALGAAYKAIGKRLHTYPSSPGRIRSYDRSSNWRCVKEPGYRTGRGSSNSSRTSTLVGKRGIGARPGAVFEWIGPANPEFASLVRGER